MKDSVSIQIKEIRPDELSAYCHGLTITYGCASSLFGTILVAYAPDGICRIAGLELRCHQKHSNRPKHCCLFCKKLIQRVPFFLFA